MGYISSSLQFAGEVINFYLPVLLANPAIFCIWLRFGLDIPTDYYTTWHGKRIIGHTRSLASAVFWLFFCGAIAALQGRALAGLYLGAGAMTGTNVNSFIKRRLGLAPGKSLPILDETDFVVGSTLFYASAFPFQWNLLLGAIVIIGVIHRATNIFVRPIFERPRL